MQNTNDKIWPIRTAGLILLSISIIGVLFFSSVFLKRDSSMFIFGPTPPSPAAVYFVLGSLVFYLLTGIGILRLTRWGYYFLKIFLYIFLLAFPVGTFISYKFLSYIKKNNIKKEFGLSRQCGRLVGELNCLCLQIDQMIISYHDQQVRRVNRRKSCGHTKQHRTLLI